MPAAAMTSPRPRQRRIYTISCVPATISAAERSGTAEFTGVSARMAKRVKQLCYLLPRWERTAGMVRSMIARSRYRLQRLA